VPALLVVRDLGGGGGGGGGSNGGLRTWVSAFVDGESLLGEDASMVRCWDVEGGCVGRSIETGDFVLMRF
jgi:hypothetical protein